MVENTLVGKSVDGKIYQAPKRVMRLLLKNRVKIRILHSQNPGYTFFVDITRYLKIRYYNPYY